MGLEIEDKCNIKNGEIKLCKEMYNLTTNMDTKIEKVTCVRMNDIERDFIGSVTFRYGRKKFDLVALSFCIFCGGELR